MQGGKILAVAACEESQSVASASSNGSVHVWRVEYTTRSGGAPDRYTGIIGKAHAAHCPDSTGKVHMHDRHHKQGACTPLPWTH